MSTDDPAGRTESMGPPPLFFPRVPLESARLADIRHALSDWATLAGLPDDDVEDLVLVTYEALTLSLHRPTRPGGQLGAKTLQVESSGDEIIVAVTDHAAWQPPPADNTDAADHRSRLAIYRIAPRSELHHTHDGTTTYLFWPLPGKRGG